MGVRGGKSSKCPCILCTERALLHWRQAHEVARPVAPLCRQGDVGIRQGWRLTRSDASSRRKLASVCVCVCLSVRQGNVWVRQDWRLTRSNASGRGRLVGQAIRVRPGC
jgi:hypothetical protein